MKIKPFTWPDYEKGMKPVFRFQPKRLNCNILEVFKTELPSIEAKVKFTYLSDDNVSTRLVDIRDIGLIDEA